MMNYGPTSGCLKCLQLNKYYIELALKTYTEHAFL